ncbi:MAG TPA: tetratricopeptide repeat protein [Burkholderiaceae bacterium]|nr:tetratricopeptide repeat protein [Burkholderiaceae bacterium]
MAYDLEEQEQIAAIKAWWAKWGNGILAAVLVAILAAAAWQFWSARAHEQARKAGSLYAQLVKASEMNDSAVVRQNADVLINKFGSTVYAPLAAMHAARRQFDAGDLDAAKDSLRWVIESSGRPEFAQIARVRLAGVLLDAKLYDEALSVLAANTESYALLLTQDRRGDVLLAMGQPNEARVAWQAALDTAPVQHPLRGLIQFKLDALPAAE